MYKTYYLEYDKQGWQPKKPYKISLRILKIW